MPVSERNYSISVRRKRYSKYIHYSSRRFQPALKCHWPMSSFENPLYGAITKNGASNSLHCPLMSMSVPVFLSGSETQYFFLHEINVNYVCGSGNFSDLSILSMVSIHKLKMIFEIRLPGHGTNLIRCRCICCILHLHHPLRSFLFEQGTTADNRTE